LKNCCGYTFVSQQNSTGDFTTTEKTGVNGSFSGASFVFTDGTAASFVVGDVGKWLLVVDATNPKNNGWYKITGYTDASDVTIDFRSGAAEFPTAQAGLTWFVMAEGYQVTSTVNDYVRAQTSHADSWQVEFKYVSGGANSKIDMRVSVNADWTATGKILSTSEFNLQGAGANDTYNYMVAESTGTFFMGFQFTTAAGNCGAGVAQVSPAFETGHAVTERWSLFGPASITGNTATQYLTRHWANWGYNRVWRDYLLANRTAQVMELTHNTNDLGFCDNSTNEVNVRTTKNDVLAGSVIIVDADNTSDAYEIPGMVSGSYMIRDTLATRGTVDNAGTKDLIHLFDGIAIDWPSLTPQY